MGFAGDFNRIFLGFGLDLLEICLESILGFD